MGMPRASTLTTAGILLLAVAAAAAAPPPGLAGGPWRVVRNAPPQRAAITERHERPIHYPRRVSARPQEPDPADRLLREFLDLHTAMRYQEAAEVARRAVAAAPGDPTTHYNLACALSRLHRADDAIEELDRAVGCGWRDAVHLVLDPDLHAARRTARYPALLAELRRLVAEETAAVAAGAPEPETRPGPDRAAAPPL